MVLIQQSNVGVFQVPDTRTWGYHPDGRAKIFPTDDLPEGWLREPLNKAITAEEYTARAKQVELEELRAEQARTAQRLIEASDVENASGPDRDDLAESRRGRGRPAGSGGRLFSGEQPPGTQERGTE